MTERTPAWEAIRHAIGEGHFELCMNSRDDHDCEAVIDEDTTELYRAVAKEVLDR